MRGRRPLIEVAPQADGPQPLRALKFSRPATPSTDLRDRPELCLLLAGSSGAAGRNKPHGASLPIFVWIQPCRKLLERPGDYT